MLIHGAYILHTRKYRETSLLVQLFTQEQGLLSAIAKGVVNKKSQSQSLLQPFQPLTITLSGKKSLYNLYKPEIETYHPPLPGKALIAALYANELLIRFCAEEDPHPTSYIAYSTLLDKVREEQQDMAYCLREFEWKLFADTGYAFDCSQDQDNTRLQPDGHYILDEHWKLIQVTPGHYIGIDLLHIHQGKFNECPRTAKRFSRDIITRILGKQGLQSWRMFQ